MPRGSRIIVEDGTYHILTRGNNKRCIFRRDSEFRYFKKLLHKYKYKYNFLLYHYAIMKNHLHLCLKLEAGINISKIMQGVLLSYNHYLKRRRNYVGYLWQNRYKSFLIRDERYLLALGIYIEKNAVEAGFVENPLEYPWSSYRYYALGEDDPLIDPNPLYLQLGQTPTDRQKDYVELMQARIKESQEQKVYQLVS